MLVLTRKPNQQLHIGNDIVITVVKVRGNTIRLGIEAPRDVRIIRSELEAKPEVDDSTKSDLIVAQIALATECDAALAGDQPALDTSAAASPSGPSTKATGAESIGHSDPAPSAAKRTPLKPFTNRKPSPEPRASRNVEDGPMCHCPSQANRPAVAKDKLARGPLSQGDSLKERASTGRGRLHNFSVVSRS